MSNTEFVDRCKAVGLYEGSLVAWLEKVESLQAKVKELEAVISALSIDRDGCYEIISVEQSKVKVLTDALEYVQIGACSCSVLPITDDADKHSTLCKYRIVRKALATVRGK